MSTQGHNSFTDAINGLYQSSHRLEKLFPGRAFTPDGHMVGSIGEAAAQAFYGVKLVPASAEAIDGYLGSRSVQIKATTGNRISFMIEGRRGLRPEHLIAYQIFESGELGAIYNGPYSNVLESLPLNAQRNGQRQIATSKLMDLDSQVPSEARIPQLIGRTIWPYRTPASFRRELISRARAYAIGRHLRFYESTGPDRVVLFENDDATHNKIHGNFDNGSFGKILVNDEWSQRLQKSHTQRRSLPAAKRSFAKELDSCTSSDALLMNVFCHPKIYANPALAELLGFKSLPKPKFGYDPGLMKAGRKERIPTEIDMVLSDHTGALFCEANGIGLSGS